VLLQGAWRVAPIAAPMHVEGQPVVWFVMSAVAVGTLLHVLGAAAGSIEQAMQQKSQSGFAIWRQRNHSK
jgi:hypothetical protein